MHVIGTEFLLDGAAIEEFTAGKPLLVTARDVLLSGRLADGTPFGFQLNTDASLSGDFFAPGATLMVTLVPEPPAVAVGFAAAIFLAGWLRRRRRMSFAAPECGCSHL